MSQSNNIFLKLFIFSLLTNVSYANISGVVFQDLPVNNNILNTYGKQDNNELGIQNITVTAYPGNHSTLTDINGVWELNTTQNSRIEFSNFPSYLKESSSNNRSSSVQFINDGTIDVKFGLHNINDYANTTNPIYVNNLQENGTHIGSNTQSIHTSHYQSTGLNANYQTLTGLTNLTAEIPIENNIKMEEIGSVWGKAYQKNKKRLFVSSMLQRHIGFANTPAHIYMIDYTPYDGVNSEAFLGSFSLEGMSPANGGIAIQLGTVNRNSSNPDFELTNLTLLPSIDLDAYAKVGKISYGGIDVDHNKNQLWLINLNQKGIISLDISNEINTSTANQYLIENFTNVPTCVNGILRPWAMKVHKDKGYIGAICDASISKNINDMFAYVLSFDLNISNQTLIFNEELSFPLNYQRQLKGWQTWEDVFSYPGNQGGRRIHSQPILSDIEFDKYDNMYLAFIDRYATQVASTNYSAVSGSTEVEKSYNFGEILKICNTNGNYEKEGTGNCIQANFHDLNVSEFFNDQGGDANPEASLGSLALLQGSNELLVSLLDPHPQSSTGVTNKDYWYTQGTQTLSLNNGAVTNWYATAYTQSQSKGLNGKANGMGDIELITAAAPIELGNRIWLDSNADGIQDPNEHGTLGVKVNLVCNDVIVETAITNSTGNYIFSNDSSDNVASTASHRYDISELIENSNNCFLSIPDITGTDQQDALKNYILTSSAVGQGNNPSLNDSNAIINGTNARVIIQASDIPISGQNNHSFDIGFKLAATPAVVNPAVVNPAVVNPAVVNPPILDPITILGSTICQEMILNDDTQAANAESAVTIIDVLNNDTGSKAGQEIKFLSLTEGERIWKDTEQNISSVRTLDTLVVEEEGTWSVQDNKVIFTALTSFDGQIPTPVYYIIEGEDCTSATRFSNVAQIRINTSCSCPTYSEPISSLSIFSMILLMLLTSSFTLLGFKEEIKA